MEFAAQITILGGKLLIGLKITDQIGDTSDWGHRPIKGRDNTVNYRQTKPFYARAINTPNDKYTQEHKDKEPDQQSADRAEIILGIAVIRQYWTRLRLAVVVNHVAQLLFILERFAGAQSHTVQAFVSDRNRQTGLFAQGQIKLA